VLLADVLTWGRIALALPTAALLAIEARSTTLGAAALFFAGAISDFADGYVARRTGRTSASGTWLDPLADKFLVDGAALALGWRGVLPLPVALTLIARDVVVTLMRQSSGKPETLVPGRAAKIKTALLYAGIEGLILLRGFQKGDRLHDEAVGAAATSFSIITMPDYSPGKVPHGGTPSPPGRRFILSLAWLSQACVAAGIILSVLSAVEYAVRLRGRRGNQSPLGPRQLPLRLPIPAGTSP
jgi:CDP-diacylglycerol--glycerol-3-phosphate 3-phosphatidyltransferase